MKRLAILAALVAGALALASDVNTGTVSSYSQPVGVRDNATGKVHPMSGSDGGVPNVRVQSGTVIATGSDGGRVQADINSGTLIATGPDGGAVTTVPGAGPEGYRRTASGVVRMTNLAAAGSQGYKLTATCYECEVADEQVNICYALTCTDAGGIPMNTGSRRKVCFDHSTTGGADGGATQDVSGWSTSATGDWNCTPIF